MMMTQKGSAGLTALFIMLLLAIIGGAYVTITSTEVSTAANFRDGIAAQYLAEAGVQDAIVKLKNNANGIAASTKTTPSSFTSSLKNKDSPTKGTYTVTITGNGNQRTITSIATVNKAKRQLVVTVTLGDGGDGDLSDSVFQYAAFSGNIMILSGKGAVINGDVGTWHPSIDNPNGGIINGNIYLKDRSDKKFKDLPSFKAKDYESNQTLTNLQANKTYNLSGVYNINGDMNMNNAVFTTNPDSSAIIYVNGRANLSGTISGNIIIISNGGAGISNGNYSDLRLYSNNDITIDAAVDNALIMSSGNITINSYNSNSKSVIYAQKDITVNASITGSVVAGHTLRINSGGVITYDKKLVQQTLGLSNSKFAINSWSNK